MIILTVAALTTHVLNAQFIFRLPAGSSSWQAYYTPLQYPHPLQASYTEAACEDTFNVKDIVTGAGTLDSYESSDIQSYINSADDDDCVKINKTGSVTWTTGLSWGNKRIQLIFPGESNLTVTCPSSGSCIIINNTSSPSKVFRITAVTLVGRGGDPIRFHGDNVNTQSLSTIADGFRIDHITIRATTSFVTHGIEQNGGIFYGLIDHFTCDSTTGTDISECAFFGPWLQSEYLSGLCDGNVGVSSCDGYWSWRINPVTLGSDDGIVMEDSNFSWNTGSLGNHSTQDTAVHGSIRHTLRFSTITCGTYQTHGARANERGMGSMEVYRNNFTGNTNCPTRVSLLHNGVAHWFENTIATYPSPYFGGIYITGYRPNTGACVQGGAPLLSCNGSRAWDGNLESNGWPCLDDVGRRGGTNQGVSVSGTTWDPYKAWSNGTTSTCKSGGTCNNTSIWTVNSCGSPPLTDYYKPYNNPHSNAAGPLGPANMWDYMDQTTGGIVVYTNVSDLPGTCTSNTYAWVTNTGTWNQAQPGDVGYGQGSGVLYKCS